MLAFPPPPPNPKVEDETPPHDENSGMAVDVEGLSAGLALVVVAGEGSGLAQALLDPQGSAPKFEKSFEPGGTELDGFSGACNSGAGADKLKADFMPEETVSGAVAAPPFGAGPEKPKRLLALGPEARSS